MVLYNISIVKTNHLLFPPEEIQMYFYVLHIFKTCKTRLISGTE